MRWLIIYFGIIKFLIRVSIRKISWWYRHWIKWSIRNRRSLKKEGFWKPWVTWNGYLIDGHKPFEICILVRGKALVGSINIRPAKSVQLGDRHQMIVLQLSCTVRPCGQKPGQGTVRSVLICVCIRLGSSREETAWCVFRDTRSNSRSKSV